MLGAAWMKGRVCGWECRVHPLNPPASDATVAMHLCNMTLCRYHLSHDPGLY